MTGKQRFNLLDEAEEAIKLAIENITSVIDETDVNMKARNTILPNLKSWIGASDELKQEVTIEFLKNAFNNTDGYVGWTGAFGDAKKRTSALE